MSIASPVSRSVVRQINSLFEGSSATGMSDGQLLDRFTARRDAAGEAAFAALVTRHGAMVLGICNEHLGDRHHAEDAFQAVFLVLAQERTRSVTRTCSGIGFMASPFVLPGVPEFGAAAAGTMKRPAPF